MEELEEAVNVLGHLLVVLDVVQADTSHLFSFWDMVRWRFTTGHCSENDSPSSLVLTWFVVIHLQACCGGCGVWLRVMVVEVADLSHFMEYSKAFKQLARQLEINLPAEEKSAEVCMVKGGRKKRSSVD